jgi:hypothetical protein
MRTGRPLCVSSRKSARDRARFSDEPEGTVRTVAALFVATDGCYFGLPDVDPWDVWRDARLYAGPHPVVAHPPCERWGRYWGGGPSAKARRTLGDDGGCFASALASVRRWGGVLEHPEGSHAFEAHHIARPTWRKGWESAWDGHGYVCCVAQGNYGHRARKLTWLYAARMPIFGGEPRIPDLDWTIPPPRSRLDYGYHSAEERRERHGDVSPRVNLSRLTTRENIATPVPFRDMLLDLARRARPSVQARKSG